jgi:hypothetical protein
VAIRDDSNLVCDLTVAVKCATGDHGLHYLVEIVGATVATAAAVLRIGASDTDATCVFILGLRARTAGTHARCEI